MKSVKEDQRVDLVYEVETFSGVEECRPPFVIGVLSDFTAGKEVDRRPFMEHRFVAIDRDNFAEVRAKFSPSLEPGDPLPTPYLALHRLVNNVATGTRLKIRVVDINKSELREDLGDSNNLADSFVYKRIFETEYGIPSGQPYGLLIVDFEIEPSSDDLSLLTALAEIAAKSATMVIVAPSPRFFGVSSFTEVTDENLREFQDSEDWQRFQTHPAARFVALALPRFAVAPNQFANAGWLLAEMVAQAITHYDWPAKIDGELNSAEINEVRLELLVSESQQRDLGRHGLCVLSVPNQPSTTQRFGLSTCDHDFKINETLCAAKFQQAVRSLCRDNIGAFMDVADMERRLQEWLQSYTATTDQRGNSDPRRPLRGSQVSLKAEQGKSSAMELSLQLGFQFEHQPDRRIEHQCEVPFIVMDDDEMS